MLRPTPGDPWGVEQHHRNTGAKADPAVQDFQNLRLEFANVHVNQALTAQGISSTVNTCDGSPKNYREWIKSIEIYAVLVTTDDDRKKLVAYQSSGVQCLDLFKDTRKQMRLIHGLK